jgi:hypothetical protein
MEVEEEDEILQRLFFKKFDRALPEQPKKSDVDDIDMDLIDLTKDNEEMEADTTPVLVPLPIVVVKAEPIKIANANLNALTITNVAAARAERKEFNRFAKAAKKFAKTLPDLNPAPKMIRKTLWKSVQIPEKETPQENVIAAANADMDMSEDKPVDQVNSVESVEPVKSDAELEAEQREFDAEFGHIEDDNVDEPDEFD